MRVNWLQGILVDGTFVRLKETLTTSFPELEIRHGERKSDDGWTERQALESALLETPITVFMYCLHALRVDVRDQFPPTTLADVVDADEGGATTEVGGVGGGYEKRKTEEQAEEEDDEVKAENNAVTVDEIADWLKVYLHFLFRPPGKLRHVLSHHYFVSK